jgi:hypothetical protein
VDQEDVGKDIEYVVVRAQLLCSDVSQPAPLGLPLHCSKYVADLPPSDSGCSRAQGKITGELPGLGK